MPKEKRKLPEAVRKQFAKWGRQGGLKGSRADKIKAGKASGLARQPHSENGSDTPDGVQFTAKGYMITYKGVTHSVSGWSRKLRIPQRTIRGRIQQDLEVSAILQK